jgi:hypothetical protein
MSSERRLNVDEPPHDDIARRAYELHERRGGRHGHDWDDWFEAERELRGRSPGTE